MERIVVDFYVVIDTLIVDMVVIVGKLDIDMVVVGKPIVDMVVDMMWARWQQLDGKSREHMVELYFSLLILWHWSYLLAFSRS